jgi:hypothetical protein
MNWLQKNLQKIVYIAFLVPIITVAFVSISHVTTWYGLTNNGTWSLYLSFGIEIAALAALAAISVSMGRKVYLPFGIVTLIQLVGNVFYSYTYIDENSKMFKDWVELSNVFFQYIIEEGDIVGHKRILALFSGGLLPIISLSFLHLLVKFQENETNKNEISIKDLTDEEIEEFSKVVGANTQGTAEPNKINPTTEDLDKIEKYLDNLSTVKFGKSFKELDKENNLVNSEVYETPKPTKRPYKPRVTPTLLEDILLNDELGDNAKPKTVRRKKINLDLNDLNGNPESESEIKRLVYRKRDNGGN